MKWSGGDRRRRWHFAILLGDLQQMTGREKQNTWQNLDHWCNLTVEMFWNCTCSWCRGSLYYCWRRRHCVIVLVLCLVGCAVELSFEVMGPKLHWEEPKKERRKIVSFFYQRGNRICEFFLSFFSFYHPINLITPTSKGFLFTSFSASPFAPSFAV